MDSYHPRSKGEHLFLFSHVISLPMYLHLALEYIFDLICIFAPFQLFNSRTRHGITTNERYHNCIIYQKSAKCKCQHEGLNNATGLGKCAIECTATIVPISTKCVHYDFQKSGLLIRKVFEVNFHAMKPCAMILDIEWLNNSST